MILIYVLNRNINIIILMSIVIDICSARNLTFKPAVVHVDLEITVHNVFRQMFPWQKINIVG
jgi:hypothetical protein